MFNWLKIGVAAAVTLCFGMFLGCGHIPHYQKHTSALTWREDFNQPSHFDTSRWSKIPRGHSDWNRHMSNCDSCYAMRDGKLILRGIKNNSLPNDTSHYLTGGVYTKGKVIFGFGKIEIRAKLNGAEGAWPAFWMLAEGMPWPKGGEIDIMERLNYDEFVYQTCHSYYTIELNRTKHPDHSSTASINPSKFNIYGVAVYQDSLVFYVNHKKTFSYPRIKTDKAKQFPYAKAKHYLLLSMQLGGSWVGTVNPDDLPVEMAIDWVQFYAFKNE